MAHIFEVTRSQARILYCEVDKHDEADLCVYKENNSGLAHRNDALWFTAKSDSKASSLVHKVSPAEKADLTIHYVDTKHRAGWNKEHPLQGVL
jgi:hypothetical protein